MQQRGHRLHSAMIVYFDAIRRAGSIRAAARQLNVASSAVNRQLLKLEEELGVQLFDRLQTGLKLTHAGSAFARHAIAVLQDAERLRSELEAMRGLRSGHVEIAAIESLVPDLLPRVIAQARTLYPKITVGVSVLGSSAIPELLTAGDADLGLAFDLARHRELDQIATFRLPLGAVMTPDHPLASREALSLSACMAYPLILPKADLSIRPVLERTVSELPQGVIETNSVDLARRITLQSHGISFQTRIGIEEDLAAGRLCFVPIASPRPLSSDLGVYVRHTRNLPVAAHALAGLFSEALQRLAV